MASIPRPLSKPALKKLFLKLLLEFLEPQGKFSSHSRGADSVISMIPHHFDLEPLTAAEKQSAWRAVFELERDGFIQRDIDQGEVHKIFMERGLKYAKGELGQVELGWIDFDELLRDEELKSRIRDDYVEGDFESCVFKAFRLLEERVRLKASQPASSLGTSLMSEAFAKGLLKHPDAHVPSESDGIHALMRGAISWFKNPASHRSVAHSDPQVTAEILGFADYLLTLVDQCVT
jgi:uncharacterized protein (TIGR02391 family)